MNEIITRSQAKSRGLMHYFTGKPCRFGHTLPRRTKNGSCSECVRARRRKYRSENIEKVRAAARTDKARKYFRDWRAANKEKSDGYHRTYIEKYPERRKATMRRTAGLPDPTRPEPDHCECCGGLPGRHSMCLDHDHNTGEFRGWLCTKCNSAIGKLGDDLDGVLRAVKYLTETSKKIRSVA